MWIRNVKGPIYQSMKWLRTKNRGLSLSKIEISKQWPIDGIKIKIIFSFHLKPRHRSELRSTKKDPKKKKKSEKWDFLLLTILGMEVELPFSIYPRNRFLFFSSHYRKTQKKNGKIFFSSSQDFKWQDKIVSKFLKKKTKMDNQKYYVSKQKNKTTPNFISTSIKKIYGLR